MKVLQVLYSGLGGHGSVVTSLIRADKKKQWKHYLLFYGIEEVLPEYLSFCKQQQIPFGFVKKERQKTPWRRVVKNFREHKPDVILLHSPNLILPAYWYALFTKTRLYVVEHTPHGSKGIAEKIFTLFSLLLAKKVVCLTPAHESFIKKKYWFVAPGRKTKIIENGIDLSVFKPVPKMDIGLNAGMIARFNFPKDQLSIVKVIERMVRDNPMVPIQLYLAGDGSDFTQVQDYVQNKKLQSHIHLLGLLNEAAILQLFNNLNVYVHKSGGETMCTAVMQALASGIPVVASRIQGISNIVDENKNAFLFDNDDLDTLELHLRRLVNDKHLYQQMSDEARSFAIKNFSSEKTFIKYNDLVG
jgi:L-malate glycosyltransferase